VPLGALRYGTRVAVAGGADSRGGGAWILRPSCRRRLPSQCGMQCCRPGGNGGACPHLGGSSGCPLGGGSTGGMLGLFHSEIHGLGLAVGARVVGD
jgi:hypothetical protein